MSDSFDNPLRTSIRTLVLSQLEAGTSTELTLVQLDSLAL